MQQEKQDLDNKATEQKPQPVKKNEWTEVTEKSVEEIKKDAKEKWDKLPGNSQKNNSKK